MKVLVLMGSPKKKGNTQQMCVPFIEELEKLGAEVRQEWIYDMNIKPCLGCKTCQDRIGELGCVHNDDFAAAVDMVKESDLVVFATPIYCGFAPGPVKTLLDRMVYASVKKYGKTKAPSLIEGKKAAILITSGGPPKMTVVAFEYAVKVLCASNGMEYLGWTGGTDPGGDMVFMNEKKAQRARDFAAELMAKMAQ